MTAQGKPEALRTGTIGTQTNWTDGMENLAQILQNLKFRLMSKKINKFNFPSVYSGFNR